MPNIHADFFLFMFFFTLVSTHSTTKLTKYNSLLFHCFVHQPAMSTEPDYRRRHLLKLLFLCFLSFVFPSETNELQSLLSFKSALGKSNTLVFESWKPEIAVCNFTGIVCNSDRMVKEINLAQKQLTGTLPFDSICSLKSLEKISLGSNFLHGAITDHLRNCTGLQYLDLAKNSFTGMVPDLSPLSQLKLLNLNNSGIAGSFPWQSLENLTGLTFLSLGDNSFDSHPFPPQILKLEKLYWLYLTNCSMEGQIPKEIGNLTQLVNLELSDNSLSGEIPDEITQLSKLWQLELYDNNLTGTLPPGLGNLIGLANVDVSTNHLYGDISELKSLINLESLHLFENQFSGEIPEEFGEFKKLQALSLYTNKFTGSLPEKIGSWADFEYIDVSENFLMGPIPPDMCKKGKLLDLLLLQNKLTGEIPETYANCWPLHRLRVNNNSLSGVVPAGIWSLPNVEIIDLTSNGFEGSIASSIGKAKSLAQLFLSNNHFSGELPENLSEASSLVELNLSSNQFSGEIPGNIGELKNLGSLHMEDNLFTGKIPVSLSSCVSLNVLNLAGNSISGEIPEGLGSLRGLNALNLSNNQLSGEIPVSLSSLKLSLLDLRNNKLIGQIPDSLSISAFDGSFDGNPGLCSQSSRKISPCSSYSSSSHHLKTVVACFAAVASVLIFSLGLFFWIKLRRSVQDNSVKRFHSWDMKQFHMLSFNEEEVVKALNKENLIGKGGSGNVYKIMLRNGKELAVKHIWKSDFSQRSSFRSTSAILSKDKNWSPEYDAEVATLSSVRHINVVKLYCSITSEDCNLLVYEYLPNGSLWDRLHTHIKVEMDWLVRYDIALGAARGLEYLHHGCDRPIIHRDVKSSNILLDEHMKPRIADFGLAKILQGSYTRDSTLTIAGTHGYIAPEYAYTCKVNEKSDVYSFGVVLMELVSGKRAVEPDFGENKDIVQWVFNETRSRGSLIDLVDPAISEALKEDAGRVLRIAVHCTTRVPAMRPSMRMVVQMLEEVAPSKVSNIVPIKVGENGKNNEL